MSTDVSMKPAHKTRAHCSHHPIHAIGIVVKIPVIARCPHQNLIKVTQSNYEVQGNLSAQVPNQVGLAA